MSTSCAKVKKFHRRSNEDVFASVDKLAREKAKVPCIKPTPFGKMETDEGFKHCPEGLLLDRPLRAIYKPADHTIRDWQHIMCQDGVANTHIFNVITAMDETCDIGIDEVQEFSQLCNYPSIWGKLEKAAFGKQRLRASTIASFSSTILTMVPVLFLFLQKFVQDTMPAHFAAFQLLWHIIGILRMGPEDSMKLCETLLTLMSDYLEACTNLYGAYVKPKAHHMFHLVDGMLWLGRLLSCFVTERKHREIKAASLHVFRHLEHTVLHDVVNRSMEQILEGHDLYTKEFRVNPRDVTLGTIQFRRARTCVIKTGLVANGDMVINESGDVAKVISIWQKVSEDGLILEVEAYPCINDDLKYRATQRSRVDFFKSESIVDVLIWYEDSPGIICVPIPPALLYRRA